MTRIATAQRVVFLPLDSHPRLHLRPKAPRLHRRLKLPPKIPRLHLRPQRIPLHLRLVPLLKTPHLHLPLKTKRRPLANKQHPQPTPAPLTPGLRLNRLHQRYRLQPLRHWKRERERRRWRQMLPNLPRRKKRSQTRQRKRKKNMKILTRTFLGTALRGTSPDTSCQ